MLRAFTRSDVAAHTFQIFTLIDGEDAGIESLCRKWLVLLPPSLCGFEIKYSHERV